MGLKGLFHPKHFLCFSENNQGFTIKTDKKYPLILNSIVFTSFFLHSSCVWSVARNTEVTDLLNYNNNC